MGYPSIPFTVTLTDDFNLFFEKTVDFYFFNSQSKTFYLTCFFLLRY